MTTSQPYISLILCTHNPKLDYIQRCIDAIQAQTLDYQSWELLIIDNHSTPAIHTQIDVSWHPNARIITEPRLGLTQARLCGFEHAKGTLFILVDDDNILQADYLKQALELSQKHPKIGVFGGSISGIFEHEPPEWLKDNLIYLAVREIKEKSSAKQPTPHFNTPAGAGMCIRSAVALHYQNILKIDNTRKQLDRQGSSLVSSGDTDLAYCAWDLKMEMANFPELKLQHIIPANRMTIDYMSRLHEGMAFSDSVLNYLRTHSTPKLPSIWRCIKTKIRMRLKEFPENRQLFDAHIKGRKNALRKIKSISGE